MHAATASIMIIREALLAAGVHPKGRRRRRRDTTDERDLHVPRHDDRAGGDRGRSGRRGTEAGGCGRGAPEAEHGGCVGEIPRGFWTGGIRRCYRSWPATQGARRCCRSCASSALRAVCVDVRQAEHGGRVVLHGAPRCARAHDAGDRLDGAVGVHERSRSSNAAASRPPGDGGERGTQERRGCLGDGEVASQTVQRAEQS